MSKNSLCSWGCLWIADPLPPPKRWDCKCAQPPSHCHNLSTEFCPSCSGLTEWWVLYSSLPPPVTTTQLSVSVQPTSPGVHPSYKVQSYGSFHFANSWCHLVGSFVVRHVWTFPSPLWLGNNRDRSTLCLFIRVPVDGNLGCFCWLAVISAAISMGYKALF